ncbi:MAG: hypothetical protein P4L46_13610, partial [Fimbriimonas sp.]|nr:hypothetical protein [Fimbriimonas sp.]
MHSILPGSAIAMNYRVLVKVRTENTMSERRRDFSSFLSRLSHSYCWVRIICLLLATVTVVSSAYGQAQVPVGGTNEFPSTGQLSPPPGYTWDILNPSSASIANSSVPNGWFVSYNSASKIFLVGAPSNAIVAVGYTVRYSTINLPPPSLRSDDNPDALSEFGSIDLSNASLEPSSRSTGSASAVFNVVPPGHLGPPPPTGLVATLTGLNGSQVLLNWSPSQGATWYMVLRGSFSGGPYSLISGVLSATTFTDTNVTIGATYYYVVIAGNNYGWSGYSNQAQITVGASGPPVPSGLTATPGNNQVSLAWNASIGATSYTVYRGSQNGGPYSPLSGSPTAPAYVDSTAQNGSTYYYVVTASNAYGTSAYSNPVAATLAPNPPTNLTATPGISQVTLSWTASPGATSYTVLQSTSQNGTYTAVSPQGLSTTSFTSMGLTNGQTYWYYVTATNAGGTSGYSNSANATPEAAAPPAPTNLTATPGNALVTLTWIASSGATSYTVLQSTSADGPWTSTQVGNATAYTSTGLVNGTTYY